MASILCKSGACFRGIFLGFWHVLHILPGNNIMKFGKLCERPSQLVERTGVKRRGGKWEDAGCLTAAPSAHLSFICFYLTALEPSFVACEFFSWDMQDLPQPSTNPSPLRWGAWAAATAPPGSPFCPSFNEATPVSQGRGLISEVMAAVGKQLFTWCSDKAAQGGGQRGSLFPREALESFNVPCLCAAASLTGGSSDKGSGPGVLGEWWGPFLPPLLPFLFAAA